MGVRRGERSVGLAVAALLACAALVAVGWSKARGAAEEEQPLGRYQAAAPDLILDTATGKLVTSKGQVLEPPIDAAGKEVGRYTGAGYVTAVTRSVGLDVISRPTMSVDVVKGYVVADAKTGRVLRQRVYYSQAMRPGDL